MLSGSLSPGATTSTLTYSLPQLADGEAAAIYQRYVSGKFSNKILPDVAHFESTETVFNRGAKRRDLRRYLRRLPLREALAILGTLSLYVQIGRQPMDAALQVKISTFLTDNSRRLKALNRRLRQTPDSPLIYEEQLAVLSCFAVAYCAGTSFEDRNNLDLLKSILAYSSVRGSETPRGSDPLIALLFVEVRHVATDNENLADVFRRWQAFFEWASSKGKNSKYGMDLERLCREALGMSYTSWVAATFILMTYFSQPNWNTQHGTLYNAFLNADSFLYTLKDRTRVDRLIVQCSMTTAECADMVANLKTTSLAECQQLMRRPFVDTSWGLTCPSLRLAPNVAGNGMLFRLGEHLIKSGAQKESDRLRQFYGDFLEDHVFAALAKASYKTKPIMHREIRYGKSGELSSDISLFYDDSAVFVDVTATRFVLRDSVVDLNLDAIDRDLNRFIVHKIKDEISRCARDFRSGRLKFDYVDVSKVKRIYGLVVSPQGLPRLVGINARIKHLMPGTPDLNSWDYFDLNEVELLANIYNGELNLASLIEEKQSNDFGSRRTLVNYLHYQRPGSLRATHDRLRSRSDEVFERVISRAREWGLRDLPSAERDE